LKVGSLDRKKGFERVKKKEITNKLLKSGVFPTSKFFRILIQIYYNLIKNIIYRIFDTVCT